MFWIEEGPTSAAEKLNSTALLFTSRGKFSSFKLSKIASCSGPLRLLYIENPRNSTETRRNIGKAPESVSIESKADQTLKSVRHEEASWNNKSSRSSSRMLFPAINPSSRLSPQEGSRSLSRIAIVVLSPSDVSVRYALIARLSPSPANSRGRYTTKYFAVKILKG